MSFSSSSKGNISLKKLVGKAHTSNNLEFFNESKSSGITVNASAVFGESLPSSPANSNLYDITSNVVELVRLVATPLPESIVDGKFHGFKLSLPDNYTTGSINPGKESGVFVDGQDIHDTKGALQLVPPSFSDNYEAKLFYGGDGGKNSGTRIPLLDNRNWYLDYFNGVLFQENPPADSNENPSYVEAFVYIGQMASERFTEGGGGGGATDISDLNDVTISSNQSGHLLVSNGVNFSNRFISISELSDVDSNIISSISDGNVLSWNAASGSFFATEPASTYSNEQAQDAASGLLTGSNHTGISFSYDDANNVLAASVSLESFSLSDLSNVTLTGSHAPSLNQILKWDGTNFVPTDETGKTESQIQDIVGAMLTGSNDDNEHISFTYDNINNALTASVSLSSSELEDGANLSLLDANQTLTGNKTFTGNVDLTGATATAATLEAGNDSTSIATTAFVNNEIEALNLDASYQPLNSKLTSISNINISNHDILVGNGENSFTKIQSTNEVRSFLASSGSIDDLSDVSINIGAINANHVLKWSGTEFVNSQLSLSNISDTGDLVKTSEGATFGAFAYDFTASTLTIAAPSDDANPTTKSYVDNLLNGKQDADPSLDAITGISDGDLLIGNGADSFEKVSLDANVESFLKASGSIGSLSDVNLNGNQETNANHFLVSDGNGGFVNKTITTSDLSNDANIVLTTRDTTFGAFAYDFTAGTLSSATPAASENSTKVATTEWVTSKSFITGSTIGELSNVLINTPNNGQILIYDADGGNQWKNLSLSGDATLSNDGAITISNNAISNSKIEKSFIDIKSGVNSDRLNLGEEITLSGTNNEIEVSVSNDVSGSTPGATITIGLPDDVVIGGGLTVAGDLSVNGTTTTINTANLSVEDTLISLNTGIVGENTSDIGFFLNRGTLDPAVFVWDESEDFFKIGTHSDLSGSMSNIDANVGFSFEKLRVETPDASSNNNDVATTAWVTSKSFITGSTIGELSDVNTAGKAEGKLLKFNADGDLVVADGNGFVADTSSLWATASNGDLFPHGIIDGTLDTGMFAINLSAGNLSLSTPDVTLHDILEELSSMNAYTPSTRDAASISDTFFEFDANGDIVPKEP